MLVPFTMVNSTFYDFTCSRKRKTEGQFPFSTPLPPPIANISLSSFPSYRRTNSDMPTPPSGFAPSPSLNSSPSYRRTNSDMLTSPFGFAPSPPNSNIHTPPSGFAPSPPPSGRSPSLSSSLSFSRVMLTL